MTGGVSLGEPSGEWMGKSFVGHEESTDWHVVDCGSAGEACQASVVRRERDEVRRDWI
jgi:hypothetical protein